MQKREGLGSPQYILMSRRGEKREEREEEGRKERRALKESRVVLWDIVLSGSAAQKDGLGEMRGYAPKFKRTHRWPLGLVLLFSKW